MKKIIFYTGCFVSGCLFGHLISYPKEPQAEQQIQAPFDDRLIGLLSEYEEN